MSTKLGIPVEVRPEEIAREKSLGAAIELCAKVAGYGLDKELSVPLGVDKGQFSRWMLHARGYDLHSLRQRESETERENRLLREEVTALRRVLTGAGA